MSYQSYAAQEKASESPRDLEIRAISFVTRQLMEANTAGADLMARIRALNANMRLWAIMVEDLSQPDNALPAAIKARYISLGSFAKRHSVASLMDGSDMSGLIQINTDVLEALEYQRQSVAA